MLLSNLNLDSLRTLVVAQDLGGFGRASERLLTYTLGYQPADEATSGRNRSAALSEARSQDAPY